MFKILTKLLNKSFSTIHISIEQIKVHGTNIYPVMRRQLECQEVVTVQDIYDFLCEESEWFELDSIPIFCINSRDGEEENRLMRNYADGVFTAIIIEWSWPIGNLVSSSLEIIGGRGTKTLLTVPKNTDTLMTAKDLLELLKGVGGLVMRSDSYVKPKYEVGTAGKGKSWFKLFYLKNMKLPSRG